MIILNVKLPKDGLLFSHFGVHTLSFGLHILLDSTESTLTVAYGRDVGHRVHMVVARSNCSRIQVDWQF